MKSSAPGLRPALVALMSIATGLAVADHPRLQPQLAPLAHTFAHSFLQAGFILFGLRVSGTALALLNIVNRGLTHSHQVAVG